MEIRPTLFLSTAHLSRDTARSFEQPEGEGRPTPWADPIQHGYFCYAYEETEEPFPADLAACCRKARQVGAEYLRFDCDADTIPGLSTYDW